MRGTLSIRKRTAFLLLVTGMAFILIWTRLFWVQLLWGRQLGEMGLLAHTGEIPVEAPRGNILDRDGNLLVDSVSVDSLYAVPVQVKDPAATAAELAEATGMDQTRIFNLVTQKAAFVWLKRKVDDNTAARVKALNLPGIGLVAENERQYRHGGLAASVLGFTGVDNQGLTGVEKAYDRQLTGENGAILIERDAGGRNIPAAREQYLPPTPGDSLKLTIDTTIQSFVERELDQIETTYHPKTAVILVMNPKTGGLYAMGTRPTFNPAAWQEAPQSVWDRNPAIWYNYEPGSTFKIVTLTAALGEGVVNDRWRFFDPGFIKVAGRIIHCWYDGGHGSEDLAEVVQNSCNPGFVEMGLKLGVQRFYKYLHAFGFGRDTGIDLPGEAQGIVIPEKRATNLNIATMALGQSIAVTPIQLLTAMAAIANGGVMMKPHVVSEVLAPDGRVIQRADPVGHRVIPAAVAGEVDRLLAGVIQNGTGKNAWVEGYPAAGKTGTAQVVGTGGGYVSGRYVASFVGFAPVDDPKAAVLVMIAQPQGGQYFGGVVAAPVFSAVMGDTLRYLRVPRTPDMQKPVAPFAPPEEHTPVTLPNVVNYPAVDALAALQRAGVSADLQGEGWIVSRQTPAAGVVVRSGTRILLDLGGGLPVGDGRVAVPDLTGLTVDQAGGLLDRLGLRLDSAGSGIAAAQNPPAGSLLVPGSPVRATFRLPGRAGSP
ncbi:MAG: penicillin-binding transpeptidase domain-containing protein [Peptococcaceae bacterium]|nr:penicillin-binding transpeptidase domain-containing protein [Peptococcaceae bacterium]